MYARVACYSFLVFILSGCTTSITAPPIVADHPASPDAAEAAVIPPSRTLVVTAATTAADDSGRREMDGMQHDVSHGSRPMNHQGMQHSVPNIQSPATSQTATTQAVTLYTCTMHPEVISDKPGKCPKCGMKLVESKSEAR